MLRKAVGVGGGSGSGGSAADAEGPPIEPSLEFAFPHTGPLQPPEPPYPYTASQLETTYNQAVQLWPTISKTSCANALASKFADGDPNKAIVLIQFYFDAAQGYVTSVYKQNGSFLTLRGADNYGSISCYADSLLVAMFSRIDNFEPLLYKKRYEDRATDQFATWLRLFVNLLRNGERITEDIVEAMLATAVAAGWTAGSNPLSQQDAAEFFVFITEKLKMPLLALKVDIAHAGKEVEEYDHKLIREQLLYLPVPGDVQDPPILLEECLEVYFSNAINVSRHLARPSVASQAQQQSPSTATSGTTGTFGTTGTGTPGTSISSNGRNSSHDMFGNPPARHRSYSIMSVASPSLRRPGRQSLEDSPHIPEMPPLGSTASHNSAVTNSPATSAATTPGASTPPSAPPQTPPIGTLDDDDIDPLDSSGAAAAAAAATAPYLRTPDQSRQIQIQPTSTSHPTGSLPSYHQLFGFNEDKQAEARVRDIKQSLWTSNNEITLPAWMFLQLMPFYADISPNKDPNLENLEAEEVANHFRQTRPVLGCCLKRYFYDDQGRPQRNNRTVIVPDEIHMPSFVADDSDQKQAFGNFKLVLESAIFHRGSTINSGHYLALYSEDVVRHRKPSSHGGESAAAAAASASFGGGSGGSGVPPGGPLGGGPPGGPPGPAGTRTSWLPTAEGFTFPSSSSSAGSLLPGLETKSHLRKRWYLFDDLQTGGHRIKEVDYTSVFENECPYMLFYRMVSLEDEVSTYAPRATPDHFAQSNTSLAIPINHASSMHSPGNQSFSSGTSEWTSRPQSRAPSPEPPGKENKDKKKKSKFFRRHKDKERDKPKDYASKYREEKCIVQ